MKKAGIIITIVLLSFPVFSQDDDNKDQTFLEWADSKDWKLNAASSFTAGLLTESTYATHLHGYFGFLQKKIEFRGDVFYMLSQYGERPRFSMNHQLYAGALYHFTETSFQPYIGFQPGIALSQSSEYGSLNEETGEIEYKPTVNPLGSAVGGIKYYGERFFFLFAEARYLFGKHKSNSYPIHLDELRFSFGLGLYL